MVDNGENILVEFDYDNISVIDPNKVIDNEGKVKERFVKQENLVFYANLECSVLPRTKLALGSALNDSVRTISVGKINFLNPGHKTFLDNSYTNEITGKNTLQGQGVNQPKLDSVQNPNKSDDYYITQNLTSNGNPGAVDNGLLGITEININIGTDFLPVIDITMVDIKGRALFEGGNNSPYAAFFQLPYPMFYLTLKGYYGKAVRYPIMLQSFTTIFDPSTHNFTVKLRFYGYKYTVTSYINWGQMLAVPHMYNNYVSTPTVQTSNSTKSSNTPMTTKVVSRGYQKIKELYAEYKSKGLIDDNFPEITVTQLKYLLDRFIKDILTKFSKENLGVLTQLDNYGTYITEFQTSVFFSVSSWFNKYMDTKNFYVLKNSKLKVYTYKKEYDDPQKRSDALTDLSGNLIKKYTDLFNKNSVVGVGGSYTIGGVTEKKEIPVNITIDTFTGQTFTNQLTIDDINLEETYAQRFGSQPTPSGKTSLDTFREKLNIELTGINNKGYFYFEGKGSFMDQTAQMAKELQVVKTNVQELIVKSLSEQLTNKKTGIGFVPTIRNICAVFFAQGEAFLRLLDDVHVSAWDVRDNKYRKAAIFNKNNTTPSVDYKEVVDGNQPVYPWPQLIVETIGDDNKEKFEIRYPGDLTIAASTNAYVPYIWPEVEFVEEFVKGFTERDKTNEKEFDKTNVVTTSNRISLNSIEFPINNQVFQNKEEVKYFYEIYERIILNTFFSRLSRKSGYPLSIYNVEADAELQNILKSLSNDNPFLIKKLKEYNINDTNFTAFLRHISNQGEGESWQKFIRGEFVTQYLKNKTTNSFGIFNQSILLNPITKPTISLKEEEKIVNYVSNQSTTNDFEFSEIYPITDLNWIKTNMANGKTISLANNAFKTNDVLTFNIDYKNITNFDKNDNNDTKRPITNFNYKSEVMGQDLDLTNLKTFYQSRLIEDQFITEGNINYSNYENNLIAEQTSSMLNTPYFINSIQSGVNKFRYDTTDLSSYKLSAYLFLNSLPLATLKEKYKTYGASTDLSYILSTLKKFGAVHKLPYSWILKYGSIWHRYKTWIETGNDILDEVWKNFDYQSNFDPVTSALTKTYVLNINGQSYNVVLEQNQLDGGFETTNINTGFYPKTYDDFNVFYQGLKLFTGATQINGTCTITGTTMDVYTGLTSNSLAPGQIISGPNIQVGTTIVSQISGTPGGDGQYSVNISQNSSLGIFYVTNSLGSGYDQNDIQNLINEKKLTLINSNSSNINYGVGFDDNNLTRLLRVTTWSALVQNGDNTSSYVLPSFGSNINQTKSECFLNDKMTTELTGNTAMYNGSVRLFWPAPHYGYFDHDKLFKTTPDQYLKEIFIDKNIQQNFSINGDPSKYSKIDDMFSAFEKGILDSFEDEFLNFSRSVYDFKSNIENNDQQLAESLNVSEDVIPAESSGNDSVSEIILQNFQLFMRSLMKITKPVGDTGELITSNTFVLQKNNFFKYLTKFMEYNVVFKYGNPTNFDRRLFYTFSTQYIQDPFLYKGYNQASPSSVPTSGGTITLAQSKTLYPDAWKSLETYVGFSDIPELSYGDNGSYITDFFPDMNVEFTEKNIVDFAPIIKIYATQKLNDPTLNISKFFGLMNSYLNEGNTYLNNVIKVLMPLVRKGLPDITVTQESQKVRSNLEGEQTRVELWELFKSLNDTWIAGADFKTKTLFEDVLFLDRASRDVGQKVLVDIFKVKDLIESNQFKNSLYDIVNTIFMDNHFVVMNLPSYANFYNVQDVSKNPIPRSEGSTEFANSLFGTFLNVDYRTTTAKLVCMYASKPSEHLAMKDNIDYRFRDDAFDLRRASDNPLTENLINKTDWDKSNKVVGFNVDIGPQNQQIFKSFDVSQDPGQPTSESLEVLNQMANVSRNRSTATQNVSLYNLYKNRSYKCSVDMMGNALIQPTMYFNLRNVPMFSGPYMITSVQHRISENGFDTIFQGIRQPFYSLPKIDNFIQSLSVNILETIKDEIKKQDNQVSQSAENVLSQKSIIVSNALGGDEVLTENQNCSELLYPAYNKFTTIDKAKLTTATFNEVNNLLKQKIASRTLDDQSKQDLRYFIFSSMYVDSYVQQGFKAYENNYSTIDLRSSYGALADKYITTKYFCVSKGNNLNTPLASFESLSDFLDFFIERFVGKLGLIKEGSAKEFAKLYILEWPKKQNQNVYDQMDPNDLKKIEDKFVKAFQQLGSLN